MMCGFQRSRIHVPSFGKTFCIIYINFDLLISRFLWTEDCFSSVPRPDIHGHLVHWLVCTRSWRLLSCNPYMWSYKFVISESLVFFAWDAKIVCILKLHLIIWFRNPLRWWLSGLLVCCSESIGNPCFMPWPRRIKNVHHKTYFPQVNNSYKY